MGDKIIIPISEKDKTISKIKNVYDGIRLLASYPYHFSDKERDWLEHLLMFAGTLFLHIADSVGYDPNYWKTAR